MQGSWRNNYIRYRGFFLNIIKAYRKKPEIIMFLELILTFSTITLLSIFALRPTLITIAGLVKEIKAKEELIGKMDKKIRDLDTAQNLVFSESRRISILDSAIPTGPSVESLSSQMEGLSTTTGVTINTFSVEEVPLLENAQKVKQREKDSLVPEGAEGLTFTLRASDSFSSLSNLIASLENMRRPAIAENIIFAQTTDPNSNQVLILTFTGQVPYVKKIAK